MSQLYAIYKKPTSNNSNIGRLTMKGWKKIYNANINQKKGVAMLISYKVDFRTKKIIREKRVLYNDKRSMHQENISILNVYAPNNRAVKYLE